MSADTHTRRFSERTIRQVRMDCTRAMLRARFSLDHCDVIQLRCVDEQREGEQSFGSQLWYFEGMVDGGSDQGPQDIFGVIEYSVQYGLLELVEDGVFDSQHERERFRHQYERDMYKPASGHVGLRWLATGVVAVTLVCVAYLMVQMLSA